MDTTSTLTPVPSSAVSVSPIAIDLTQDDLPLMEPSEESQRHHFGTVSCRVVGIRYYVGKCHPGEFVRLVREPCNLYDSNAVRVDNLRGEKVGHIKREQALPLSNIMDLYGPHGNIIIDGTIPSAGNSWNMPVNIDFYGTDLSMIEPIAAMFQQSGTAFVHSRPQMTGGSTQEVIAIDSPIVQKCIVDWRTQQKDLDDMFDEQCKLQLQGLPHVPTPSQLKITLLDHQISGLQWMVRNETQPPPVPFYKQVKEQGKSVWLSEITNASQPEPPKPICGGILADDMGLGKTIQAISLILANPPIGHTHESPSSRKGQVLATRQSSDVVPFKSIINKIKVPILQCILKDAGICVTSFKKDALVKQCMQLLESGKLSADAFNIDLTHKSHPSTNVTIVPKTTLVLCPVSVMSNWVQQIEAHVQAGTLRVSVYHGAERELILPHLDEMDVLVASFNTIASDFSKHHRIDEYQTATKKTKVTSIFYHKFHRIILDEAHMIRNTKTRAFKACSSLQADFKWALTGTPLQNKASDIHSLFSFLGVEPLGDHQVFRRAIAQPLQQGDPMGLSRLRVMMAHVALRRNKQAANLNIPDKVVELRAIQFPDNSVHKRIHDTLFRTARFAFAATLSEGDVGALKNYTSIFETLLRIRQACCSGILVPNSRLLRAEQVLHDMEGLDNSKGLTATEGKVLLDKLKGTFQETTECAVCLAEMEEAECVILRACSHVFCHPCLTKVREISGKCPFCRLDFVAADMIQKSAAHKAVETSEVDKEPKASVSMNVIDASPKIQALLAAIDEMKHDEKGVIFSQFTSFLDEIEQHMKAKGHTFARIDGSKSAAQRLDAINCFSSNNNKNNGDSPRFMVCSLHAAGTGINLTRGNHVFMMDTWWNKAVEMQAMDRVHRLSQTRKVRVVRFVMANSIEERMVELQEVKAAMGKGTMERLQPEEARRLRIGEFRKLFDLDVIPIEIH